MSYVTKVWNAETRQRVKCEVIPHKNSANQPLPIFRILHFTTAPVYTHDRCLKAIIRTAIKDLHFDTITAYMRLNNIHWVITATH